MSEIFRGCIRGCRFCQAGFIYRPVREKSPGVIDAQSTCLCHSTGYEEFSLSSLSTSDYTRLPELLEQLLSWAEQEHTNISLPSLRVDGFSEELANRLNVLPPRRLGSPDMKYSLADMQYPAETRRAGSRSSASGRFLLGHSRQVMPPAILYDRVHPPE